MTYLVFYGAAALLVVAVVVLTLVIQRRKAPEREQPVTREELEVLKRELAEHQEEWRRQMISYRGLWDASANDPSLTDETGTQGHFYRVVVDGTQDLGSGPQVFLRGDFVLHEDGEWTNVQVSDRQNVGAVHSSGSNSLADSLAMELQGFTYGPSPAPFNSTTIYIPAIVLTNRHPTNAMSLDIGLKVRVERGWMECPSDEPNPFPVAIPPMTTETVAASFTISEALLAPMRPASYGPNDRSLPGSYVRLLIADRIRDERLDLKIPASYPNPGAYTFNRITPADDRDTG